MSPDHEAALASVRAQLASDYYWFDHPALARDRAPDAPALHLAIFGEPALRLLLTGEKTAEARCAVGPGQPYEQAAAGDAILIEDGAGAVVGLASVAEVCFFILSPAVWDDIVSRFGEPLRLAAGDLAALRDGGATHATLLALENVRPIEPVRFPRPDARGWRVL